MSQELRQAKKDENILRMAVHKMQSKTDTLAPRRAALGELGNKVRNVDASKKAEVLPEKKSHALLAKALKEVKPRVDSWRTEAALHTKKSTTQHATGETTTTAQPRLVRAKTLQTAKPHEVLRVQFAAGKTSKIYKSTDSINNVKVVPAVAAAVLPVRRQESNLTRRSLTKIREVIKQESKSKKSETEAERNGACTSQSGVILQPSSHSTILLSDVENIDINDEANQILVAEYVNDIYSYLNSLELTFPVAEDYLSKQTEVSPKMRAVLIDWINEVHLQFHLLPETFYMTVAIVDRYLQAVETTTRENLQLVGVTALFLASKYEELFPPEIKDFVYITDDTYTKEQILEMERHIVKKLNFQLGRPLPIHFLRRFSKAAHSNDVTHMMAKYFIELACVNYPMAHFRPSEVAAAALMLSLRLLERAGASVWTSTLHFYTTYSEDYLRPIVIKLAEIVRDAPTNKVKAVYTKYRMAKFNQISVRSELDVKYLNALIAEK